MIVDGVVKSKVQINGTRVGNTLRGRSYANACIRIGGLSPGNHSVQIVTKSNNTVHFEYMAGSDQPSRPRVLVGDILKGTGATYGYADSDANIDAHNLS